MARASIRPFGQLNQLRSILSAGDPRVEAWAESWTRQTECGELRVADLLEGLVTSFRCSAAASTTQLPGYRRRRVAALCGDLLLILRLSGDKPTS